MKTEMITPRFVTIKLTQEREDPDYGSCLWARFTLDLDRYSMQIMSDCGNYAYARCPTPDVESFLHLVSRMDGEYLLGKISKQSVVNTDATYKAVMDYLEELKENEEIDEEDLPDSDSILSACTEWTERDCFESLKSELDSSSFWKKYDDESLAYCIETDYPCGARKIRELFEKYIRPLARKMDREANEE